MVTILSIHIPKTAGSFFGEFLRKASPEILFFNYGPNNQATKVFHDGIELSFDSYQEKWGFFKNMCMQKKEGTAIMHGHFLASSFLNEIESANFIFWLREPLSRLISHYSYWTKQIKVQNRDIEKNLGYKRQLFRKMNPTFEEFACSSHFTNMQAHYVKHLPMNKVVNIGIFEKLNFSIKKISECLQLANKMDSKNFINAGPCHHLNEFQVSDSTKLKILQHNNEDIKLYERVICENFPQVF